MTLGEGAGPGPTFQAWPSMSGPATIKACSRGRLRGPRQACIRSINPSRGSDRPRNTQTDRGIRDSESARRSAQRVRPEQADENGSCRWRWGESGRGRGRPADQRFALDCPRDAGDRIGASVSIDDSTRFRRRRRGALGRVRHQNALSSVAGAMSRPPCQRPCGDRAQADAAAVDGRDDIVVRRDVSAART